MVAMKKRKKNTRRSAAMKKVWAKRKQGWAKFMRKTKTDFGPPPWSRKKASS